MEKWRLLNLASPNRPEMNLAIEEAVFHSVAEMRAPPTVMFWRNDKAVVVGYSQSVEAEVDLDICEVEGVRVARRFSGGGTVFHDHGNLNYSIIIKADHPSIKGLDVAGSHRFFVSGVITFLEDLGLSAVFSPPSDIMVNGKKISGNAQARRRGTILHHGTLLVNSDLDLLNRVLKARASQDKNSNVSSRRRPVTNLIDELGCSISIWRVTSRLKKSFEKAFSIMLVESSLTMDEARISGVLCKEKYARREWIFLR
ncbi:MAG: lipoate--protein ligase family protein [Nitrososphaerota archaeon]|nr:lipoate--protein ligase family protein [Candidatus Bathyarchaeota archaeon]MDW8048961.1 lipoate--protein ligase family protein [Nitrososphaerota archaeon]